MLGVDFAGNFEIVHKAHRWRASWRRTAVGDPRSGNLSAGDERYKQRFTSIPIFTHTLLRSRVLAWHVPRELVETPGIHIPRYRSVSRGKPPSFCLSTF